MKRSNLIGPDGLSLNGTDIFDANGNALSATAGVTLAGVQTLTNKKIEAPIITPSSGTQAALIANITITATGTEIATAVNAILVALKGAGIIASS